MKTINLKFNKLTTCLAGNAYGKEEFERQVGIVDYNEKYMIKFPEQIELIATSFIQGFFNQFVSTIGLEGISNDVEIVSSIPNIKNYILDCLN